MELQKNQIGCWWKRWDVRLEQIKPTFFMGRSCNCNNFFCELIAHKGQSMVGVPKRITSFSIQSTITSKTCYWNLMTHSYWQFDFTHNLIHYKGTIICIKCQIWTSSKIFTKSLKKIQDFVTWKKTNAKIHKECSNNFFWPKIFTTKTLYVNVYKMYACDKN